MKRRILLVCYFSFLGMHCSLSYAGGGISIHATRIIYPLSAKQDSVSVVNSSDTDSYLVQSWVEDSAGHKTSDFIATPPLYVSDPHNENTLRIMLIRENVQTSKESLYYFVVKAIPGEKGGSEAKSSGKLLKVATASRIKLFVRPEKLPSPDDDAISKLTFHFQAAGMEITNPTPYYFTLTHITVGSERVKDVMIAPGLSASEQLSNNLHDSVNFHTLNDFGAISKSYNARIFP